MPKKLAVVGEAPSDTSEFTGLATWQAAGLALAAISISAHNGLGAALGAVLLAPVILAFTGLRRHAPSAVTTSDLIGATLGGRLAAASGLVQLAGYTLFAAAAAQIAGLAVVYETMRDSATTDTWWWPVWSVVATAAAGALVYLLSSRLLASVTTVLAAASLLIYFYLSLATIARVWSGTAPVDIGLDRPMTALGRTSELLLVGLAVVGFEVITTRSRQLRSAALPMGLALAAVSVCGITIWLADHLGAGGSFGWNARQLALIVDQLFGTAGDQWLIAGGAAASAATLLVFLWAATNVAGRAYEALPSRSSAGPTTVAALVGMIALLLVVLCRDWGGLAEKLSGTGAILIVVLYAVAAEANWRIPGSGTGAQWLRVYLPVLLAAVVLIPLRHNEFSAAALWPVAIAAVLVALAYVAASVIVRRSG